MTNHAVVSIGGAPFIRPYENARGIEHYAQSSSSSASTSSPRQSPRAPWNILPPSYEERASLSTSSSSSSSLNSSPSSSPSTSPQLEAALRYSSALHQHTRNMWEKERSSIEKLRLEASTHQSESASHHHRKGSSPSAVASSAAAAAAGDRNGADSLNRRSSLGSALGVDALFGRKKRHQKNKSIY